MVTFLQIIRSSHGARELFKPSLPNGHFGMEQQLTPSLPSY
jgi:hypothetical protein